MQCNEDGSTIITIPSRQQSSRITLDALSSSTWTSLSITGDLAELEKLLEKTQAKNYHFHMSSIDSLTWLSGRDVDSVTFDKTHIRNHGDWTTFTIRSLRYLLNNKLDTIDFLSNATSLETIELARMPKVLLLPNFSRLHSLRRVIIAKMKRLTDLSPIIHAPSLLELFVVESPHLEVHHFECIRNHPTIIRGNIFIGGQKKCQQAAEIVGMKRISR
ncbi:MAG: hypothetical protein HC904_09395 [Blastochloris sp.]|nr:hypothetical protein [Blastochloris sp.]